MGRSCAGRCKRKIAAAKAPDGCSSLLFGYSPPARVAEPAHSKPIVVAWSGIDAVFGSGRSTTCRFRVDHFESHHAWPPPLLSRLAPPSTLTAPPVGRLCRTAGLEFALGVINQRHGRAGAGGGE